MAVCPKCKAEYREGFDLCSDCNVELVDSIEDIEEENLAKENTTDDNIGTQNFDNYEDYQWVFLKNVADGYEYNSVIALLQANDVPFFEKNQGTGQLMKIYTGQSRYGTEIYVPKSRYEEMKDFIENIVLYNDNDDYSDGESKGNKDKYFSIYIPSSEEEIRIKKRYVSLAILGMLIAPIVFFLFSKISNWF